jgi:hypothetical protein
VSRDGIERTIVNERLVINQPFCFTELFNFMLKPTIFMLWLIASINPKH